MSIAIWYPLGHIPISSIGISGMYPPYSIDFGDYLTYTYVTVSINPSNATNQLIHFRLLSPDESESGEHYGHFGFYRTAANQILLNADVYYNGGTGEDAILECESIILINPNPCFISFVV